MIQLNDVLRELMSTKAKSAVSKKTKAKTCLCCDRNAEVGMRGLCKQHYHQFNYACKKHKSKTSRAAFEAEQIRRGLVLPSRRGRHGVPNVFEVTK